MREKVKTTPDLSVSSKVHQKALEMGSEHFREWSKVQNVTDAYKGMSVEEIKTELKSNSFPYAVCFENWISDFNLGTGLRNANAFGAREIFYLGNKRWDKRSAVGVNHYSDMNFLSSIEDFKSLKSDYHIVGVDNVEGSISINNYVWRNNSLLLFGSEGVGLTPEILKLCDSLVSIEMFGSVRSLNCGTASGIVMNDFVTKYKRH